MSKNQIMLDYLSGCEAIKQLSFQYGEAQNDTMQLVTSSVEAAARSEYIDGSQTKRLDYTLIWYKALGYVPVLTNAAGQTNENVADLDDVQGIIDWIDKQNDDRNFPDFGADCADYAIRCLHDVPQLVGIDTSHSPPLAKYTFTIRVEFLDLSHCLYKRKENA